MTDGRNEIVGYWYPVLAHRGAGGEPWFAADHEGLVRRFVGHPMGSTDVPSFYVVDDVAYTTGEDETRFCAPGVPWFSIVGSMISPGEGHPNGHSHVSLYQQRTVFDLTLAEHERNEPLMSREQDLLSACVEFADTSDENFDLVDAAQRLTDRCVALVDASEAGIMLADRDGTLCLVASSSERMRLVDVFELEHHEGPNLDAYESGSPEHRDMSAENAWPSLASRARAAGFASVSVFPLRLRAKTIGTLSMYSAAPGPMEADEQSLVQALADIATIGILSQRELGDGRIAVLQLEQALESRIVIEQAKGILSERLDVSIDAAFTLLRGYARNHNRTLRATAAEIVNKHLHVDEITGTAPAHVAPRPR